MLAIACGVAVVLAAGGAIAAFTRPSRATAMSPIPLGIVGASGHDFGAEQAAGLKVVMIGVIWSKAEPSPGTFSMAYLASLRTEIADARSRSLGVVLDPGLQYPPSWVFSLPGGTRFVDQYGDAYTRPSASGANVANAVTDGAVRSAEAQYLTTLSAQIPGSLLSAIQTGGGPDGELSYPGSTYNGHTDCFWAYDASTQGISPVPGWRPGTGTTTEASAFLAAYNRDLNAYGAWLDARLATDFHTRQLIMLGGWGERPGVATAEVNSLLTLGYDEFSQGLDFADLLPSLPNRAEVVAYSTYLDGPSWQSDVQHEDPIAYIAHVARPLGIAIGGENTGHGSVQSLNLVVKRARSLHLSIVEWMDEAQVVASNQGHNPAGPNFADLASAAAKLQGN